MNLIALLIGLLIERLATQFLHWRRMRWLDRVIDAGFSQARRFNHAPAIIAVLLLAMLLVLPVAGVSLMLGETLQGFAYLLLSIAVLLFSIGPRDIGEEVDDYCEALKSNDEEEVRRAAKSIIEGDVPSDAEERLRRVEAAVCVQANNRLFAVVFWFVILGPVAAWSYRVTDLIRRRAVFNAAREIPVDAGSDLEAATEVASDAESETMTASEAEAPTATADVTTRIRDAAELLHAWLAWVPARLTAIGYATAGHADDAIAALRAPTAEPETSNLTLSEHSEYLLARVGVAALALHDREGESVSERAIRGATAANKLVFRLLLIWAVIIAAMTLYGFTQ